MGSLSYVCLVACLAIVGAIRLEEGSSASLPPCQRENAEESAGLCKNTPGWMTKPCNTDKPNQPCCNIMHEANAGLPCHDIIGGGVCGDTRGKYNWETYTSEQCQYYKNTLIKNGANTGQSNCINFGDSCQKTCGQCPLGTTGDPHCTNILHERFNVYKLGDHSLIHFPQSALADSTDLDITATVASIRRSICTSRFVNKVVMTGSLLGEGRKLKFDVGDLVSDSPRFTLQVGDGQELTYHKEFRQTLLEHSRVGPVSVKALSEFQKFRVQLGSTTVDLSMETRSRQHWINLQIRGLKNLLDDEHAVGGILGLDSHAGLDSDDNCTYQAVGQNKEMVAYQEISADL